MPEDEALKRLIAQHTPKPRQHAETTLADKLQTMAPKLGAKLWRNTVGMTQNKHGQWITYGLAKNSSDLVGYVQKTITAEMVGTKVAVFLAVELKKPGRDTTQKDRRRRQKAWLADIVAAGGIAEIVRSEAELQLMLRPETTDAAEAVVV